MADSRFGKSRRTTPWSSKNKEEMTLGEIITETSFMTDYQNRHPTFTTKDEVEAINGHTPNVCPYCGAEEFSKNGRDSQGIQRYLCLLCKRRFKPTTGTIFDSRRIPLSEWVRYLLNLFQFVSITADSWNSKTTFQTSSYWLKKVFLILEGYQNSIILRDTVWLDETFYSVIMREKTHNEGGELLRGLSQNQYCIGVATDKTQTVCFVEGMAKPSQRRTYTTFKKHIEPGSTLIHDKDNSHKMLVQNLGLKSVAYNANEIKTLPNAKNPLEPINHVHFLLKAFLNAHSGFNRDDLQGYLNLFTFILNPPTDHLEKVAKIFDLGFENPKTLRYRDLFGLDTDK